MRILGATAQASTLVAAAVRAWSHGQAAPAGQKGNWVQTRPGKGWNTLFRLLLTGTAAPPPPPILQPTFDKTWQPGDFAFLERG